MKRLLALLMMLPCLLQAQAKIEVIGGTALDFGNIYRGEVTNRKVTVRNSGTAELVIEGVQASCGCTGAVASSNHIAPGESGTIDISFNSKNFTGAIHKTVTVNSNADGAAHTTIEFTGNVIDEIILNPVQLWVKDAEVGKLTVITMAFTNSGTAAISLKGIRSALKGLTAKMPDAPVKPGATATIVFSFIPEKAIPLLTEAIFIQTSSAHQPEVYIPIYGNTKEFKFE